MIDTNVVLRAHLAGNAALVALVGAKIYCPRLPENTALPAVNFFTRGGLSTPYIPGIPNPSIQIACWGSSPVAARQVYRAVYDALQGIQNVAVTTGGNTYYILSAREEVEGQDIVDTDIQNYFRTISFFEVKIR
jgi:hypothetical protein